MKKVIGLLAISLFMLISCSPVSTPIPPTPTLIPLSEIDLKQQILIPSSEMPTGYLATKTQDEIPNLDVPKPLKLIWQQLETENAVAGGIRVYLYESKIDVKDAYTKEVAMQKKLSSNFREFTEVGEQAGISSYDIGQIVTDITFSRCYATVTIRMLDITDEKVIIEYAQKIDANIMEYICR